MECMINLLKVTTNKCTYNDRLFAKQTKGICFLYILLLIIIIELSNNKNRFMH